MLRLTCIVEGHGEVEALPVLIRRVAAELDPGSALHLYPIFRVPRSKLLKSNGLESVIELAGRRVGREGAILVLLDSDDDCPAQLGPQLKERILRCRGDLPVAVVLAKREFESWFLAAAASLGGLRGLPDELAPPERPEDIRGAKEWLSRHMAADSHYVETMDQAAFASRFDFREARRAASFDKFYREVRGLLTAIGGHEETSSR